MLTCKASATAVAPASPMMLWLRFSNAIVGLCLTTCKAPAAPAPHQVMRHTRARQPQEHTSARLIAPSSPILFPPSHRSFSRVFALSASANAVAPCTYKLIHSKKNGFFCLSHTASPMLLFHKRSLLREQLCLIPSANALEPSFPIPAAPKSNSSRVLLVSRACSPKRCIPAIDPDRIRYLGEFCCATAANVIVAQVQGDKGSARLSSRTEEVCFSRMKRIGDTFRKADKLRASSSSSPA